MKKKALIQSTSATAIIGLTLAMGSTVSLAQTTPTEVPTPNASTIDDSKPVSLTINKRLNPTEIGGPGNGTADPAATGNPLKGAKFTGTLLNVDKVDPAKLGDLTAANYKDLGATTTGTTVSGTTGDDGRLKFSEDSSAIKQGVWLFTETIDGPVTDTETGKEYKASDVAPSSPFIVSLPYTNTAGDGWNYDVVVQPKNTTAGITKEVKDADKNVGDDIQYIVKGNVPVIAKDQTLKSFRITDKLDVENLENIRAKVELSNGTSIEQGTDYALQINEETGEVEVKFTERGLPKLSGLASGTTVNLTIDAKVKSLTGTDGIAVNQAQQHIHYPGQDKETTTESNEVKSYWGIVEVVKTEEGRETPLKGAEFELYRCEGTEEKAAQLKDQNKITIGDKSTWTTDDNGSVLIDGIHVTDVEDDATEINKNYCLKETKAPNGYVATTEVKSFKLASDSEKLGTNEPVKQEVKFENKRSEMPKLPLTGGMGIGVLAAIAILVAGGAVWFARRANSEA